MRASLSFRQRLAAAAFAAASLLAASALPAAAQTCAYDSTQASCACPTAGAGTTCFGGQLYRASDNSCVTDGRPCAPNQNWSCVSESCVCNTAAYPCGGCTAATSVVGGNCPAPAGGQYANACGACACPAGTTLCPAGSGTCVANRSCPAGTTWDPCTDTCGTPNVLLSPSFVQSGYIQINGDVRATAGNLRLDSATGANQGDTYIANGKAIRVDGAGVTSLSLGNWGAGGSSVNLFHSGNYFGSNLSTIPSDNAVAANANGTLETGQICFGNGVNCRTSWPAAADFDPTYVNVAGDTMTGDLNMTGATTDLFVAGRIGIGTTTPSGSLDVRSTLAYPLLVSGTGTATGIWATTTTAGTNDLNNGLQLTRDTTGVAAAGLGTGITFSLKDAGGSIYGSTGGMYNFWTNPSAGARTSAIRFDTMDNNSPASEKMRIAGDGNVGIGTTTPASKLDVNGGVNVAANVGLGGAGLRVHNAGNSPSVYATTAATGNAVAAIRADNLGAGRGLEVNGGTGAVAAQINGAGNNAALDATLYNHSGTNTLETVIQVRRGTSGVPAVGLGGAISFPLEGTDGFYPGGKIGSVISTMNPAFTSDLVFIPSEYGGGTEKMRLTSAGNLGIGTTAPAQKLDVNGTVKMTGFQLGASATAGQVLTANASGVGTWQTLAGVSGSGTTNAVPKFTGSTTLGNSRITDDGTTVTIAPGTPSRVNIGMNATTGNDGTVAIGLRANASGYYSTAIGQDSVAGNSAAFAIGGGSAVANGFMSGAIGSYVQTGSTATGALALGWGISTAQPMVNAVSQSLGVGFSSTVPTLFVGPGNGTAGSIGAVGIGTTAPENTLHVMKGSAGTVTGHSNAVLTTENSTHNYINLLAPDANETGILFGKPSNNISGGIVYNNASAVDGFQFRTAGNSTKMTLSSTGNLGINALAPATRLAVNGNGTNVYATDVWVENNIHVQGNETMAQGAGRGRLRVGTAWGYPGIYAETASNGSTNDLVLGASSDHVLINAGSFGRPGASATLELYGSRLLDTGGGTLSIRSGGSVVAFDGGDTVVVNDSLQLGGVARSSWPSLQQTTQYCQFNAGSGANWKTCSCPAGYVMTGWTGYNCESNGGEWECSATGPWGTTGVQVWHDSAGTAYVWTICARVN